MQKDNRKNIRLVMLETIVTTGLLSMAIMTPFFLSIGLNQEEIALSQMIFTVVLVALNVPLGWVADRFSRKWANIIGDLICAITLLCYSQVQNFWQVALCETVFGIGIAFSQGVDSSLLKHFCDKEDASNQSAFFKKKTATTSFWAQIMTMFLMLLGGPIGAIDFRLAIALSSVTLFIGAALSFFVKDDSERIEKSNKSAVRQMGGIVLRSIRKPELRLRIIAYAIARESTHGIIWVFTPLMLAVGVPLEVVSVGWVANYIAAAISAKVAEKIADKLTDSQKFIVPILLVVGASAIMFCSLNIFTVWLYVIFGMAQGWTLSTAMPMVKDHANAREQASVESFARVVAQLLYVPAVWVINRAADVDVRFSLLATIIIFLPVAIPIAILLNKKTPQ